MKVKLTTVSDVKRFCRLARQLESDVFLMSDRYIIDGKSIMGIFSMSLTKPVDMKIVNRNETEVENFINELKRMGTYVQDKN